MGGDTTNREYMCAPSVLREENRECDCRFWAFLAAFAALVALGFGVVTGITMVTSLFTPRWTDWAMVGVACIATACFGVISWAKLADYRDYVRRSRR